MKSTNLWIISDTHFNHARELRDRPADYGVRLEKGLLKIPERDILIHMGDICVGKDLEVHENIIMKLKCRKILVRGNHDTKSNNWYLEHGWDFVVEEFLLKQFSKKILFTHIPKTYDPLLYDINIHGHLHANHHRGSTAAEEFNGRNYLLISCENTKYQPITLNSLFKN